MKLFVALIIALVTVSTASAQTPLPVLPPTPQGPTIVDQYFQLASYRQQLIDINAASQSAITEWVEQIKVELANTAQIRALANPTPEQQMQIMVSDAKIANLQWMIRYHTVLIEQRDLLIQQLTQQINALLGI
jgi:Spy/CpxP family protein refolding chaperone